MKEPSVFITGTSSGLGLALSNLYLSEGTKVYGFSRGGSPVDHELLSDAKIDLSDLDRLLPQIPKLLEGVKSLNAVILNAGILGNIRSMYSVDLKDMKRLVDINVWSNKLLLDYLCESDISIDQIIAISSGAAVNGSKGWGAYSLSKASLNMLIKLYADEYRHIHFTALAPGLIDTQMQEYLCDPRNVDEQVFPSVRQLRDARGTEAMPTPTVAARQFVDKLPVLKERFESGSFVDIRDL